ncbi:MAG: AAA family ATPase [Planctomycetota bacterium]
MLKIAISGKGGTGKTTTSALLALVMAEQGRPVIAIDGDTNANLAYALGVPEPEKIVPLIEMNALIEERTGAQKGKYGAYFQMNPRVDDIPDRFSVTVNGVKLLVMGSVTAAGGGCACPEYVLLKNLVGHMLLNRSETLILDMEAGLEHFGRAVTTGVDVLLVIVNPDTVSLVTAGRVRTLAAGLGIKHVYAVGNRVRNDADRDFIAGRAGMEVLGYLPHFPAIEALQREGRPPVTAESRTAIATIIKHLEEKHHG